MRSNGAITFVQRFNSALELSLHFHMLVPDGVFVTDAGGVDEQPRFVELEAPSDEEVAKLLAEVAKRVIKMLHAHGRMLDDECGEEAEPQLLFAGRPAPSASGPPHEETLPPQCARQDGYSLHAGRKVHENDRVGLEQLARYGLRPALSLERLREAWDGTVLYEMKRRFSDGRQTLRSTPRELLLRLCALVPPRGFHRVPPQSSLRMLGGGSRFWVEACATARPWPRPHPSAPRRAAPSPKDPEQVRRRRPAQPSRPRPRRAARPSNPRRETVRRCVPPTTRRGLDASSGRS